MRTKIKIIFSDSDVFGVDQQMRGSDLFLI